MLHRGVVATACALAVGLAGASVAAAAPADVQVPAIDATTGEPWTGVVATFTDTQSTDPSIYEVTIDWGDGTSTAGTVRCGDCSVQPARFEVRGEHTWQAAGDRTVRVVAAYSGGQAPSEGTGVARVRDRAPAPPPPPQQPAPPPPGPPPAQGRDGTAVAGRGTPVVVATTAPAPGRTAMIDWGDGSRTPGTVGPDGSVSAEHTFRLPGLHQVVTTISGPGGSSVAAGTVTVASEREEPKCEARVAFAKLVAVGACLKRTSDGVWEIRGARVRVNGLDIEPVGSGSIRLLRKSARLLATGTVVVRAGPVTLYRGSLVLDAKADLPGGFNVGVDAGIMGFPIKGSAAVRFVADGADWGATIAVHLGLPGLFGGVTGDVDLRLTNSQGLVLDRLRLAAAAVPLGGLQIRDLAVEYRRIGNEWRGGARLSLPSGAALEAAPPPAEQGVVFRDGRLVSIGATLGFPAPGLALAGGVFLNKVGFGVATTPTRFSGTATLSTGSAGGRTLARIDASMLLAFARPEEPYTATVGLSPKPRTFTSTLFAGSGKLRLADRFDLASATLLYVHPGYAELGGEFNYVLLSGLVSAQARLALTANTVAGQFNGEVSARVCAAKVACVGGDVVVSNAGIGACARTALLDIGGGFRWSGQGFFMWRSCNLGRIRVDVRPARAAQAGAPMRVRLPAGLGTTVIGVRGRGAAPRVALVAPDGRRVVADADFVDRPDLMVLRADAAQETYVALRAPRAGTWTVEPLDATPLTGVRFAEKRPRPQVSASVRRGVLRYRVGAAEGRRTTFFEEGREVFSRIGSARGAAGTLRLRPADGPAGIRRIVAVVEDDGMPQARLVVARYSAPPPRRPGRVRGLRLQRRGARVCARFRPAAGAALHQIVLRPGDGSVQQPVLRRGRACSAPVTRRGRATVTVRGVSARGRRGPASRAVLRPR